MGLELSRVGMSHSILLVGTPRVTAGNAFYSRHMKCIKQKNKRFTNEESRDDEGARRSSTYYKRQQKKPLSIWKPIEQCATYIRFQTIILNEVMSNSVTLQQRKRALKAKMILQLPPSCY